MSLIFKLSEVLLKKFKIRKSKISGKGVFAKDNINKNSVIGLGFKKIKNTKNPDEDYTRTNLGKYINHSKKPNVKLLKLNNKFFIISIKEIAKNNELFIDYDSFPWEGKREKDF